MAKTDLADILVDSLNKKNKDQVPVKQSSTNKRLHKRIGKPS